MPDRFPPISHPRVEPRADQPPAHTDDTDPGWRDREGRRPLLSAADAKARARARLLDALAHQDGYR